MKLVVGGVYVGKNGWVWKCNAIEKSEFKFGGFCCYMETISAAQNQHYSRIDFHLDGRYSLDPGCTVSIKKEIRP